MKHPISRAFALLILLAVAIPAQATTYTVDSTADTIAVDGSVTFREALMAAVTNAAAGDAPAGAPAPTVDVINFAIPGPGVQTISLTSGLPQITAAGGPVNIAGRSQGGPGYLGPPLIELDGSATVAARGLDIRAGSSVVRGLIINRFDNAGIYIESGGVNTIQGCYIGTDATGTQGDPTPEDPLNGDGFGNQHGVYVTNSPNNLIGGGSAGERNIISANNIDGLAIWFVGSTGNRVRNNFIGTDVTGTVALGNGRFGVFSTGPGNTLGGTAPFWRNIISGNGVSGVGLFFVAGGDGSNNVIQGNYIGTDVTGSADLGNGTSGIDIISNGGPVNNTQIGGTTTAARNVISGNDGTGVRIIGSSTGGTMVQGNYIGTNAEGTAALGNDNSGIGISSSSNNLVGGITAGARNLLSGNGDEGIQIDGLGGGGAASGNVVQGNYIGTDAAGTGDLGNFTNGVSIEQTGDNTIGGTTAAARNIISGNDRDGIVIAGTNANGNVVQGNYIGTNVFGTAALPNSMNGVVIFRDPASNIIGGTTPGERNVISGNTLSGVAFQGIPSAGLIPTNNVVQGNYIGTDATGTADVGNVNDGVRIAAANNNLIGGASPEAGNVISGNDDLGIQVGGFVAAETADSNTIQNNLIGTNAAGTGDLGNTAAGLQIFNGSNNVIGGAPGSGNRIAFNQAGVAIVGTSNVGNSVLANSIFANDLRGIDLGYNLETPNDTGDADTGPNNFQNYPVLSRVTTVAGMTTVAGTLNSTPNSTFLVEFFSVANPDSSFFGVGFGEGDTYLATRTVTTDASGDANFSFALPGVIPLGGYVTATATSTSGDTSEFSRALAATSGPSFVVNTTADTADANVGDGACDVDLATGGSQCSLRAAIQEANVLADQDIISFNIPGAVGTVRTIAPATTLPEIVHPVAINGYSQPGAVANTLQNGSNATILIELDGTTLGAGFFNDGLRVRGGSTTIRGLVINSFGGDGIEFNTAGNNVVEGCFIGTDVDGNANEGNARTGLYFNNIANNTVGGTSPAQRNVVSGNGIFGVGFEYGSGSNQLLGSIIGLNASGTAAIPNVGNGVEITSSNNTIGGTASGARNVVSGNGSPGFASGVHIAGSSVSGNVVQGNYIGTDAFGTVDLGNTGNGVLVDGGATANTIGGSTPGAGNLIAGNEFIGVNIFNASNVVQGNYIGTDASGNVALPNTVTGLAIQGAAASNNLIGGTTAGARNVISGNTNNGIGIGNNASGNVVQGNYIGVGADGSTPLGNTASGVVTFSVSPNNIIGGSTPAAGNVIAYNAEDGVLIADGTGNMILSNSIFANGANAATDAPGIDLGPLFNGDGVTPNDAGDGDSGPNNLQNFPVLDSAISSGGSTTISGSLASVADTTFTVQFFANSVADGSGNGEGQTLIDTRTVTTDPSGNATFSFVLPGSVAFGQFITATATNNATNDTSEFSNAISADAPGVVEFSASSYTVAENVSGGLTTVTVTRSGGSAGTVNVPVEVTPASAGNGSDYSVPSSGQPAGVAVTNGTPAGGDTVTLTFAAGETSKSFNIAVSDDTTDEPDETVNLTIGTPDGGTTTGSTTTATLTITDNDDAPTLSINNVSVAEGNSGTSTATFTVTLSGASSQTVTVNYTTAESSATEGTDYQGRNGTLTFPPGITSRPIDILVNGDTSDEPDETFLVNLSAPTNATASNTQGVGTITDDDEPPATPTPSPTATATPTPTASPTPSPTPPPGAARPINISTRLRVQTGENVLIGGFIIDGDAPKDVILRAIGPSLADGGVSNVLADPVIELRGPSGELIAVNDNWRDTQQAQIAASGVAPENDLESAIVATLSPNAYTVIVRGKDDTTGTGLVEVYDLDGSTDSALVNISTRGFVETGNNVMIGGFILGNGSDSRQIAFRGLGPSLAQQGVADVLDDPVLEIFDNNGASLFVNDNWMDNPAQAVQLTSRGLAPSTSLESGIFIELPPGAFTVILSGKDGSTGVGLVEIYSVE